MKKMEITIEQIEKLVAGGERDRAIDLLEGHLKTMEDERLLLLLGELYYSVGKMTEALNKFNAVVRINPENTKAANYVTMIRGVIDYFNKDLLNP